MNRDPSRVSCESMVWPNDIRSFKDLGDPEYNYMLREDIIICIEEIACELGIPVIISFNFLVTDHPITIKIPIDYKDIFENSLRSVSVAPGYLLPLTVISLVSDANILKSMSWLR